YVFGVPGEENLDLIESLGNSKIKLIVTRHEQAAGFMAATYGRFTGQAGVCLTTVGPGATNLVTASAYAQLGGMPMLMITGQKPIKNSKQGHFQVVDTVEILKPVTKQAKQIVNGNTIPALVRESFRLAQEERPGAVHLELPEDIAAEETTTKPFEVTKSVRPSPYPKALDRATVLVEQATRPLIIIGAGANRRRTCQAITKFINHTQIPFVNTQMGKGVIDERHPLYIGTAALSECDYVHCAIDSADLIINIGHDVIEKPPFIMKHNGRQVIHINFFPAIIDQIYFPQSEIVGDIADSLEGLTKSVKPQTHWDFTAFQRVKNHLEHHINKHERDAAFPIPPQQIVKEVREVLPDDGIIALDNGMYKVWFARNYKAYFQNSLLLDNALATMGAGLPSAMVAKMINPQKMVLAVVGDGGFMMNSQELETAMRLKLDLTILLINDNGFGMIKWKQRASGFKDFGLDYGNPDFVKYAQSYGAKGYRVKSSRDLKNLLRKALKEKGIKLIEVPVDYRYNEKILTKELAKNTCNF
ncbi:MAG: acetolactate synthase large subunit, partial [Thiomicrospira sp.]